MKKHFKKLFTMAVAAVMCMSMSVCAFAAEKEHSPYEKILNEANKEFNLDAGSIVLEKSLEDVSELAQNVKKHFLFRAEQEGKEVRLLGKGEVFFLCDCTWIIEAISNLVKNALDHTDNGDYIQIEWHTFAAVVQIVVKDNGSGIHPEDVHHIFKRFYRSKYSKDKQGIGLGLSLVKAIVEAHHGTIEVDSTIGRGTTFTINFLIPTIL